RPSRNIVRNEVPEPLGAMRITSTSAGGTMPVRSLYVMPNPCEKLDAELKALRESEMWQTGAVVRKLRPENN
ncbi:hypothetical protein EZS27_039228, partial [termite gut metagenome]